MQQNNAFEDDDENTMNEINMTPLVDVMLVLLVVFLVSIPAMHHGIKVDLPKASSQVNPIQPKDILISVKADGSILWEGKNVDLQNLKDHIQQFSNQATSPQVQLEADRGTPYDFVAKLMSELQTGGITKIGFVTDPRSN